jgi:uncharacterized spore protein YtfJ
MAEEHDEQQVDVREVIKMAKDAMTVKRVYGDPLEKNGITVIPAAQVQGGGGGGKGEAPGGKGGGSGSGFGINAKPAGVYVVKDDDVVWRPAVDVNKALSMVAVIVVAVMLGIRSIVKVRAKSS